MKWVGVFLLTVLLGSIGRADVITLKDGSRVEGSLKRTASGWTIVMPDGSQRTIAADAVKSIELGISTTRPTTNRGVSRDAEMLASLRRSSDAVSDINTIIDRYQRLIGSVTDEKVLADAREDLQGWQSKKQQGLIKFGNKWVSPDEIKTISTQVTAMAENARDLLRQNKLQDADRVLQSAQASDPKNPAVLYLRGVLAFRQEKMPDARKSFEAVKAIIPGHAPTLNNLAVVAWRQIQQPTALNFYDQAMQAAGANQYILDNVAQALGTLPEAQRKGPLVDKVLRRFTELDQLLQQQRAQEGYYRWGASWLDQKGMDELKAAEKAARESIQGIQTEFDQTQSRILEIDSQVKLNTDSMQNMEYSRRNLYDSGGHPVVVPLPNAYYDMQSENRRLLAEQQSLQAKIPMLQAHLEAAQRQLPVPQFTGLQQIVGVEGMPGPADLPAQSTAVVSSTAPSGKE